MCVRVGVNYKWRVGGILGLFIPYNFLWGLIFVIQNGEELFGVIFNNASSQQGTLFYRLKT